jgi:hypothetical protein
MEELENESSLDKTKDLFSALPFMSVFPFEEYDIKLEEKGKDYLQLGISPLLIDMIGESGMTETVSFYYYDNDSKVAISVSRDDLDWIAEESERIKKMDAIRLTIDKALEEEDLIQKSKAIKLGKKFTKDLGCDHMLSLDFGEILNEFLGIYDTVLTSKLKLGLQKLSEASIKSTDYSERQFRAVTGFLNFQLHYSRIILGVVIAAKIY